MREGWEYKKFEDCLVKAPKAKQVQTSDYNSGSKYPIISQEDKMVSGYCDDSSLLYHIEYPIVIFGDHTRVLKYVDFDFVVGADGVKILIPKDFLRAKFLLYYLQWYKIPSLGYSRHYKLLKEINLPVPPLSEQQRIVSELDLLSSIIEKKKAQLKEYDQLVQSIFYDMFGDPIDNPNGWEVKCFNEVFNVTTGKLNANAMVAEGQYPFFTCSKEIFYIDKYAFDGEALLLAGNNATATYDVKYYNGKFNAYQRTYVLTTKGSNYIYLKNALEDKLSILQRQSIGGMTKYLTLGILSRLSFNIPPLPLQQSFAEKIEAIEQQKSLIQQSISETEALFNSQMDYYFD